MSAPKTRTAAAVAAALFAAAWMGAQANEPLTVDALTQMASLSRLYPLGSLSADGRYVAYTFRGAASASTAEGGGAYVKSGMTPDYASGTDVWITDTRTGQTERVTDGKGSVQEPAFSPDGRQVAFYADRDGLARIWVWNRDSRTLRRVGDAIVRPSLFGGASLRWTSDGKSLIALVLPEGMTVEQANARGAVATTPQSDSTVVPGSTVVVRRSAARASAPEAAPAAKRDDAARETDTSHMFAFMESDVALVDVATGAVRRLGEGKAIFWFAPSPDGKWVAFSHQSGRLPSTQQTLYDFEVAPVAGGPTRVIGKFTRADYGYGAWSPDSSRLAYVGAGTAPSGDVHVIDVADGKDILVSTGTVPDLGNEGDLRAVWTPDGRSILVDGKGRLWRVPASGGPMAAVTAGNADREVVEVVTDAGGNAAWTGGGPGAVVAVVRDPVGKNMGFSRVDLATGAMTRLRDENKRYGVRNSMPLVSADGSFVMWRAEDAQHAPDLWGAGRELAKGRQLSHLNPAVEKVRLGSSRLIEYLGMDGRTLRGALLLPSDYREGQRVPLVVRAYPGPFVHSNDVNRFGLEGATEISNMQMFATRGYAVLSPEIPQRLGTPMRDLMDGIHVAVNRTIELGIADPDRLAIFGQSYGGYTTISVIVQTDRFKAAAMSAGLADLVSYYGHLGDTGADGTPWSEAGQGLMGGTPWEHRLRYIENSPIFYLDRVKTPLLILHGERDHAVPIAQAEEVFVGLRRLGREVEYRKYAGEEHGTEGRENLMDYWNAVIRWFDRYVKNPAEKK